MLAEGWPSSAVGVGAVVAREGPLRVRRATRPKPPLVVERARHQLVARRRSRRGAPIEHGKPERLDEQVLRALVLAADLVDASPSPCRVLASSAPSASSPASSLARTRADSAVRPTTSRPSTSVARPTQLLDLELEVGRASDPSAIDGSASRAAVRCPSASRGALTLERARGRGVQMADGAGRLATLRGSARRAPSPPPWTRSP